MTMAKRSGRDIMDRTLWCTNCGHRCDCTAAAEVTVAGLETQEEAEPWLEGRGVLLDGQVVRLKVRRFEKNLAVLRANAKEGRQNGGLHADRAVVRRAGLLWQGESTAGSRPKDRCARPSRCKGSQPKVLLPGM